MERGHLWQGRFASNPMDENYLLASALISDQDDALVKVKPLIDIAGDWRRFLSGDNNRKTDEVIRFHERIGRPLGSETFIEYLEMKLNRPLRKRKPGPKKADSKN